MVPKVSNISQKLYTIHWQSHALYFFDAVDIKGICDKIKALDLDRDFKMDLHICKSQLKGM